MHYKAHQQLTETEWNEDLNSNLTAAFLLTRATLPLLRKSRGQVVFLGDAGADSLHDRKAGLAYHISKIGLYVAAKSMATEEARHGVTINMISPGLMEGGQNPLPKKSIPTGRYGTANDIYGALRFFLSDESNYITGSNLIVSGGWNLH
jgi:3-oxoacyl-[acyl-carrier protein] reductase